VYRAMGTSKQNIRQRLTRVMASREQQGQLRKLVEDVRRDHPEMGAKSLYMKLRPSRMGRDRFYNWYRDNGLTIVPRKNWRRTTDSSGVIRFSNLVKDRELTRVNQVWVSDITYYQIGEDFHYITLVMDQFSRKIKGYSASKTLHMEATTVPAIKMAMKELRYGDQPIIHSDGGGQYYGRKFLNTTHKKLINSMGKTAYENPHAERLNRTIKDQYLRHYNPRDQQDLLIKLRLAVKMYNEEKPHCSIGGITPEQFETSSLMYN